MKLDVDLKYELEFISQEISKIDHDNALKNIIKLICSENSENQNTAFKMLLTKVGTDFTKDKYATYLLGLFYVFDEDVKDYEKAFELFRAISHESMFAQYRLGRMLHRGLGFKVPEDPKNLKTKVHKQAFELMSQAAKLGYPLAQYFLALDYRFGIGVDIDLDKALNWCAQAVKGGYVIGPREFYSELGLMYIRGKDIPTDTMLPDEDGNKTLSCYTSAANLGCRDAMKNLGAIYMSGFTIDNTGQDRKIAEIDQKKAFEWYQQLGNLPDGLTVELGRCYLEGKGTPKDEKRALEIFLYLACIKNEADAFSDLEACYSTGKGVALDIHRSLLSLMKAYDLKPDNGFMHKYRFGELCKLLSDVPAHLPSIVGYYTGKLSSDTMAISRLGFCHQMGIGTKRNLKLAIECYQKAVMQECPNAHQDLWQSYKLCLENPEFLFEEERDINIQDVLKWYEDRAAKNDSEAILILANIHYEGRYTGVSNLFKALPLYQRAYDLNQNLEVPMRAGNVLIPLVDLQNEVLTFQWESEDRTRKTFDEGISGLVAEYALKSTASHPSNK